MRLALLTLVLAAGLSYGQCPPGAKAGACAPPPAAYVRQTTVEYSLPAMAAPCQPPMAVYSVPMFSAPVYAAPMYAVPAAPLYVVQPRRQYATPIRDFFFGR